MRKATESDLNSTFAALSDPTRRALIAALAGKPLTVSELAAPHAMSLPAVSKHLRVLESAGLIQRRRVGRSIECSLVPDRLRSVSDWLSFHQTFWASRLDALDALLRKQKKKST